jgi:hypothetical protein
LSDDHLKIRDDSTLVRKRIELQEWKKTKMEPRFAGTESC